jgi:acetyl-CoA carboxylase carboxyltransferase component
VIDDLIAQLHADQQRLMEGGGPAAADRQQAKGRWTVRQRLARLLDVQSPMLELGLWAGYGMYDSWGGAPAAGVVTIIGNVCGRRHMVIANDATVKAGAFFPATAKKVLRAQRIAFEDPEGRGIWRARGVR